jgi:hypothetical protein
VLGLLVLVGCGDVLHADRSSRSASNLVVLDASLAQGGAAGSGILEAFQEVDAVQVRVLSGLGGTVLVEELSAVSAAGGEILLEVPVELETERRSVRIEVELRRGSDPLFRDALELELEAGGVSRPEFSLDPVEAGIWIDPDPSAVGMLDRLDATVELTGRAAFATGHPIEGTSVEWRSLTPLTVTVDAGGTVRGVGTGTGRVEAVRGEWRETVEILVAPRVSRVEVSPESVTLVPTEAVELEAIVFDVGGSAFPTPVHWESDNPSIVDVDSEGRVTALAPGTSRVRALSGEVEGSASIEVELRPPEVRTRGATGISFEQGMVRGDVDPRGLETEVWFEWGTTPGLSDPSTTPPQRIGPALTSSMVQAELSGLGEVTEYYYRVVARSEGGESRGEIRSFETLIELPIPRDLRIQLFGGEGLQAAWQFPTDRLDDVEFELQYRRSGSGDDWSLLARTTESTTLVESDLSAGVEYGFRVRGCRLDTCSLWSVEVRLEPAGSDMEAWTRPVRPDGEGGLEFRGQVQDGGYEAQYFFRWGTNPELSPANRTPDRTVPRAALSAEAQPAAGTTPPAGSQSHRVEEFLSGLDAEEPHYVQLIVRAGDRTVAGEVGRVVVGSPPPGVTELTLTQGVYQASGIDLSWEVEGDPSSIEIDVQDGDGAGWAPLTDLDGSARTFTRSSAGLERGVAYGFRLRACSLEEGCSLPTEATLVLEERFVQAFTRSAQQIGPFSAELIGEVGMEGRTGQVRFEWGRDPTLADGVLTEPVPVSTAEGTTVIVGESVELPDDGATYYFRVRASNDGGEAVGEILTFETEVDLPAPTGVSIVTGPGLGASWSYPYDDAGFQLQGRSITQDGPWVSLASTPLTYTAFFETPLGGQVYEFRVQACRMGSCSEWSEADEVTVPEYWVLPGVGLSQTGGPELIPQDSGEELDVLWVSEFDLTNSSSAHLTEVRALTMFMEASLDGEEPGAIPWIDDENFFGILEATPESQLLTPIGRAAGEGVLRIPLEPLSTNASPLPGSGVAFGDAPGSSLMADELPPGETLPVEVNFLVNPDVSILLFSAVVVGRFESAPLSELSWVGPLP